MGGRVHSNLLAVLAGTPAFPIDYESDKATDVFAAFGMAEQVLRLDRRPPCEIVEYIRLILADEARSRGEARSGSREAARRVAPGVLDALPGRDALSGSPAKKTLAPSTPRWSGRRRHWRQREDPDRAGIFFRTDLTALPLGRLRKSPHIGTTSRPAPTACGATYARRSIAESPGDFSPAGRHFAVGHGPASYHRSCCRFGTAYVSNGARSTAASGSECPARRQWCGSNSNMIVGGGRPRVHRFDDAGEDFRFGAFYVNLDEVYVRDCLLRDERPERHRSDVSALFVRSQAVFRREVIEAGFWSHRSSTVDHRRRRSQTSTSVTFDSLLRSMIDETRRVIRGSGSTATTRP